MTAKSTSFKVFWFMAVLTAALAASLLCGAQPAWADSVQYIEKRWNGTQVVSETKTAECTPITDSTTGISGWYVVNGNIESSKRLVVSGTANIILADSVKLYLEDGINVPADATLNIYAQSDGDSAGELYCDADTNDNAAIGSNGTSGDCGTINIHGGKVTADTKTYGEDAAGIGGGEDGNGGNVVIYGGTVKAYGGSVNDEGGAGIGGGDRDSNGGNGGAVFIYSGDVTAVGGANAAGIGGGDDGGDSGWVYIYGGTVNATGGSVNSRGGAGIGGGGTGGGKWIAIHGGEVTAQGGANAAGIGGGDEGGSGHIEIWGGTINATGGSKNSNGGAGIGSGNEKEVYEIIIHGGNVTAQGGCDAAGIGGGDNGDGGTVSINGADTIVNATGGKYGAGIGGGQGKGGGKIYIRSGSVTAQGGSDASGIGGGESGTGGTINIFGGTVEATGGAYGAGIGGGDDAEGGTINISSGTITATGGEDAAGIGGGEGGAGGAITITGATVNATGGKNGAGIGGGEKGNGGTITINSVTGELITATTAKKGTGAGIGGGDLAGGGKITIENGKIKASGGQRSLVVPFDVYYFGGAGIGGGDGGDTGGSGPSGEITINGGDIEAQGGWCAAGIGAGCKSDCETITINGGKIKATGGTGGGYNEIRGGAGIGSGALGKSSGTITISEGRITAAGGGCGAGIGGGAQVPGGTINISGGTVDANSGLYEEKEWGPADKNGGGAGIGGGQGKGGGTITISGGTVASQGAYCGAGIGGGGEAGGGAITISGGTIEATGGAVNDAKAAGIGDGQGATDPTNITLSYAHDDYDISVKASSYRYSDADTYVTLTMENPFKDKDTGEGFEATSYTGSDLDTFDDRTLVRANTYGVTVSETQNGSIVADKSRALPESTVTLTVTPDEGGWELKSGTLKATSGETELALIQDPSDPSKYSFTMPEADVTVTAEFVKKVAVESVSLNKEETTLSADGSETLVATVLPEDTDSTVVDRTVTWKSSDEDVATVDETGKVTAVAPGTATITVTATNGTADTADDKTATCSVTVSKPAAPEVVVPELDAVTYDPAKTLADVTLSEGWAWADDSIVPAVGNSGYSAALTVDDGSYDYTGIEGYNAETHTVTRTVPLTVNKAEVTAPTIASKPYNGEVQTADVPESDFYTVTENKGGTEPGTYPVVLTLKDPANYAWEGVEGSTVTLDFVINECEHDWNDPIYTWNENNTQVTAERICKKDASHVETETVDVTSEVTKQPEGDELGVKTYTSGSFANPAFTVQTRTETISAEGHTHSWTEPTYDWAADNREVKASRALTDNPSFVEVETVTPTITTVNPNCTETGTKTYTASFTNTAFETQTKTEEIAIDPEAHEYGAWVQTKAPTCSEKGAEERVCSHNSEHKETRDVDIDPAAHAWGEPTYEWATDNSSVTATRVCAHDASHEESETATTTSAVTKEPTETEEGEKTYTAAFTNPAFAEQTKTESIPKVDPKPEPKPSIAYENTAGDGTQWTKGSSATADFTFERSESDDTTFAHFKGIQVDGQDVDASNYTAEPGSVVIKLKPAYLETLAVGEHTLTALFNDGNNASAKFTIVAKKASTDGSTPSNTMKAPGAASAKTPPKTADTNTPALCLAFVLAVTGLLLVSISRRKRGMSK